MPIPINHFLSLKNGRFDGSSRNGVDQLFTALPNDPDRNTLVVYFHGGMVDKQGGRSVAEALYPVCRSVGAAPIFFAWQSGLLEVLQHNLNEIYNERIYRRLVHRITQFTLGKLRKADHARAVGFPLPDEWELQHELREPIIPGEPYKQLAPDLPADAELSMQEETEFRAALETDGILAAEVQAIANALHSAGGNEQQRRTRSASIQGSHATLMSPEVLDQLRKETLAPGQRGLISIAWLAKTTAFVLKNVIMRFASRRDHGLYPTIAEEILRQFYLANVGKQIWDMMKQDTVDAFGNDPNIYGGTAFLEGLRGYWETGARPRLTLVGHSTGAVYICQLLKHAHARLPAGVTFNVVFLAPACDFRLLADTLLRYGSRVANLRIFGMTDALEQADQLIPLVYPRSILYLISGLLEREVDMPIVGMQRFYSSKPPFDTTEELRTVCDYVAEQPGRTIWAIEQSGPGRNCDAARHTDFDTNLLTLNSLKHIIANGFA
jgi:hypothetical protein